MDIFDETNMNEMKKLSVTIRHGWRWRFTVKRPRNVLCSNLLTWAISALLATHLYKLSVLIFIVSGRDGIKRVYMGWACRLDGWKWQWRWWWFSVKSNLRSWVLAKKEKKNIFDIWITYRQKEEFAIINKRSKQAENAPLNECWAPSHQRLTAARLQFDCGSLWMLF